MVDSNLLTIYSFLQVFGNFPVFRKLSFKSVEEWLDSSNIIGDNFHHCLHLLLGKRPQNKSFLTKLLEFCNYYLDNGTFRARQLHNCSSSLKLKILIGLLERQLIVNKQLKRFLNCGSDKLRVYPIGQDRHGSLYWHFVDKELDVRVFKLHSIQKEGEQWTMVVKDRKSFEELLASLEKLFENVSQSVADSTSFNASMATSLADELEHNEEASDIRVDEDDCVQEMFECENCKRKMLAVLPSQMNENQKLYYLMEVNKICATCKHKMLIDNLEEKFFFYLESMGTLTSLNPIVQNQSEESANKERLQHKNSKAIESSQLLHPFGTIQPTSDDMLVTSNDMVMMPDSILEDKDAELHASFLPLLPLDYPPDRPNNENIPDSSIPTPIYEAASNDLQDVLSSPSEFEDDEIEDPSFEFDLYELSEDDDYDIEGVEEEKMTNRKKEKAKSKKTQGPRSKKWQPCIKAPRATNKNNNKMSTTCFWQKPPIGRGSVAKQRGNNKFSRTMSLPLPRSNFHSSPSFSHALPFYNQVSSPTPQKNTLTKKSSSFSAGMQSDLYERGRAGTVNSLIKNKISRIGNSTAFVGTVAGSRNMTQKKFQPMPVHETPSISTPRKSFYLNGSISGGYNDEYEFDDEYDDDEGMDGFEDSYDYEDCDETMASDEHDWTWEDYDETCAYEDYSENYDDYDDSDLHDELQEEGTAEESYDDQNLKEDGASECHNVYKIKSQPVVHVIDSDDEKEEEGIYEQDNEPYANDDDDDDYNGDDITNVDDATAPYRNSKFSLVDENEDCHNLATDILKSHDIVKNEHQRLEVKSDARDSPTSEDECFVVEVIE